MNANQSYDNSIWQDFCYDLIEAKKQDVLENGISFHAYYDYTRWDNMPGYIIATIREVADPTDEYEKLEDIPEALIDDMDYNPYFYSMRIGTTPVVVDYNGTLLIPQSYKERLQGLSGEYKIEMANMY